MDDQSLAHSRYNCTYHIVFIPKYRRKAMFGNLRKEVGDILGKVCRLWNLSLCMMMKEDLRDNRVVVLYRPRIITPLWMNRMAEDC